VGAKVLSGSETWVVVGPIPRTVTEELVVVPVAAEPPDELVAFDAVALLVEDVSVELPQAPPMRSITTKGSAR
jgi:hypothetical protein